MESDIHDRIVGTWKLVSTEETRFPAFGPRATGFLMYQRDGYMSAVLANPDRAQRANSACSAPKVAASAGALAYSGRYEIDVSGEQIIHLPEVATAPGYVGTRQVRPYCLEGNRLIFSDAEKDDPSVAWWKIVWERVK